MKRKLLSAVVIFVLFFILCQTAVAEESISGFKVTIDETIEIYFVIDEASWYTPDGKESRFEVLYRIMSPGNTCYRNDVMVVVNGTVTIDASPFITEHLTGPALKEAKDSALSQVKKLTKTAMK